LGRADRHLLERIGQRLIHRRRLTDEQSLDPVPQPRLRAVEAIEARCRTV
jgi:hypothetical protein